MIIPAEAEILRPEAQDRLRAEAVKPRAVAAPLAVRLLAEAALTPAAETMAAVMMSPEGMTINRP